MLNEHIISCASSLKTHTRVQISLSMRSGTQGEDGAERLGYAQQFVLKTGESLKISEWGHEQSGDQEKLHTQLCKIQVISRCPQWESLGKLKLILGRECAKLETSLKNHHCPYLPGFGRSSVLIFNTSTCRSDPKGIL